MIKYIYVPESQDIFDYYEKSFHLNISQIIHGPSDIIKDYIDDYSRPCIIEIPEFKGIILEEKVVKENSKILIPFIDEYKKQDSYNSIDCKIYKIPLDGPRKKEVYEIIHMKHDLKYSFFCEYIFTDYGEYFIEIIANYEKESKILDYTEIIVFKEFKNKINEEIDDFKFKI